jgi:hypothetical protein
MPTFIAAGDHLLDLAHGLEVPRHLTLHSREGNNVVTTAAASSVWCLSYIPSRSRQGVIWWTYHSFVVINPW